ncbi:hypothetical protein JHK87_003005 [Glycine soja]|nr:hypothetical protein JHK87_003005 [Glycine soja]
MKNNLFKFLPNQPLASFQNPNLSPSGSVTPGAGRTPTHRVSIVPKEARRRHKTESFSGWEPNSPKVSCMGQVKSKKKRKAHEQKKVQTQESENKRFLRWIFMRNGEGTKESGNLEEKASTTEVAPSLGTMKKFASGREGSLRDFDVALMERFEPTRTFLCSS